jgi:hypothetical protein
MSVQVSCDYIHTEGLGLRVPAEPLVFASLCEKQPDFLYGDIFDFQRNGQR